MILKEYIKLLLGQTPDDTMVEIQVNLDDVGQVVSSPTGNSIRFTVFKEKPPVMGQKPIE